MRERCEAELVALEYCMQHGEALVSVSSDTVTVLFAFRALALRSIETVLTDQRFSAVFDLGTQDGIKYLSAHLGVPSGTQQVLSETRRVPSAYFGVLAERRRETVQDLSDGRVL